MAGREQIAIDHKVTFDKLNSLIRHENNSIIRLFTLAICNRLP